MSCHTFVAKLDNTSESAVMNNPTGPEYGRSFGKRVSSVKVSGIMRYMIPFRVVPTVAMEPEGLPRNCELRAVV